MIPPVQKASQIESILLLISPVIIAVKVGEFSNTSLLCAKNGASQLVAGQALDSPQYDKKTRAKTTRSSLTRTVFKLSRFDLTVKENSFLFKTLIYLLVAILQIALL